MCLSPSVTGSVSQTGVDSLRPVMSPLGRLGTMELFGGKKHQKRQKSRAGQKSP